MKVRRTTCVVDKEEQRWSEFSVFRVLHRLKLVMSVCFRLVNRGVSYEVNCLGGLRVLRSFILESESQDFIANRFLWDDVFE